MEAAAKDIQCTLDMPDYGGDARNGGKRYRRAIVGIIQYRGGSEYSRVYSGVYRPCIVQVSQLCLRRSFKEESSIS